MALALVALGRVGRPHGVHGEVRLVPYNAGSTFFDVGRTVLLNGAPHRIREVRAQGDAFVVAFESVGTREAAALLTGAEVAVAREALPRPSDDELYLVDLVGCECREGDAVLGVVSAVTTYPASTCLVIESEAGTREIPAVAPYLVGVDLAARTIEMAHASDFPLEPRRAKKEPR
jgi:16S rRNA processing protein RimM